MISEAHKFIYIHVPKTGGTTIQDLLLPYSEDHKYTLPFQDGVDSFEIKGDVTPGKHATLQDYANLLGERFGDFRVITSIRHPLKRAVSGYFSPHKWLFEQPDGSWLQKEPYWDLKLFENLLSMPNHMPSTDYLRVSGDIVAPDILIRHETFEADVAACFQTLGLPYEASAPVAKRNASVARSELFKDVSHKPEVWERVDAKYAADLSYFGFPPSREAA